MNRDVALIGFGEAGSTFARSGGWARRACAFDIEATRGAAMAELGVAACGQVGEALAAAPLVLSLVTADAALSVAEAAAPLLPEGVLFCDMNSVAPETKRAAAKAIEAAGGRYVDVALLAPVDPAGLNVPLLLAGAAADEASHALTALGFANLRVVGEEVGRASAIKMIRSVMVKGVEALTAEMMMAAQRAGVADEVLASLDASDRPRPWADKAAYNLERMQTHGLRRAAEMEEVARTLLALDVAPVMTEATVLRQRELGERAKREKTA